MTSHSPEGRSSASPRPRAEGVWAAAPAQLAALAGLAVDLARDAGQVHTRGWKAHSAWKPRHPRLTS